MGGGAGLRRLAGRRGQATVEFAFVAPIFFLCFFAAVDAGLWAVQTSASVSAAEQAAPSPDVLFAAVRNQLQQAMFGTTVVAWCDRRAGPCTTPTSVGAGTFTRCPTTPDEVERHFGARTVAVCDETSPPAPACPVAPLPPTPRCGDPPTVTVHVIGFLASLVPPVSGLGWRAGEIPIDIVATTHTLRFAT